MKISARKNSWLSLAIGSLALAVCGWTVHAFAASAQAPASDPALAAVSAKVAGSKPDDFRVTPVPGIFEYRHGAEIIYVTQDGRYAFAGDLFHMSDRLNITEVRRKELRQKLLAEVPESSMVVFAAPNAKHTITVFTDVDCFYCRKLHSQIAEYNRLGITVRYLAFPRTGPDTESWHKAEQVWCAKDKKTAMTRAKLGETLSGARCKSDSVAKEYALGQALGINGTPGIFTADGSLLPGYVPPVELLAELKANRG